MSAVEADGRVRDRDPDTSWAAAVAISTDALSELQAWVLTTLRERPRADHELVSAHATAASAGDIPLVSPQRLRTARKELQLLGRVRAIDNVTALTASGYKALVWEATS